MLTAIQVLKELQVCRHSGPTMRHTHIVILHVAGLFQCFQAGWLAQCAAPARRLLLLLLILQQLIPTSAADAVAAGAAGHLLIRPG